jgi:hypothetical protein
MKTDTTPETPQDREHKPAADCSAFRVMNFAECKAAAEEHDREMDKVFKIEDGWLTINVRYEYPIELSRIKSMASLLRWSSHLCEKTWMNTTLIREFIDRVGKFKGWDVHGSL